MLYISQLYTLSIYLGNLSLDHKKKYTTSVLFLEQAT